MPYFGFSNSKFNRHLLNAQRLKSRATQTKPAEAG
jgi:hypothetical protein